MKPSDNLFKQQALVGGAWRNAAAGARFAVHNPANADTVGHAPRCTAADVERAIEAARAAFSGWRATPAKTRAQLLRRWFDLILAHRGDLAAIMVSEQGKPLAEARGEIDYAASFIEWFAEEARRVYGDAAPSPWADRRMFTLCQPAGVAALITPWDFPAAMLTRKAGAALAAGCTMVRSPLRRRRSLRWRWLSWRNAPFIAFAHDATLLTGDSRHALGGQFFQPTVLSRCTPDMQICRDETFGPVAPLIRFASEAEMIRMANDTGVGLAAYAYTRDLGRGWRLAEQLDYGMVGINAAAISTAEAAFGGIKQSGLGREGGRSGIDEYPETKYVNLGGLK